MSESPPADAVAVLMRQLARVMRHHDACASDPALAAKIALLGKWQALRLRGTYEDLEHSPRYATAMRFFEEDLYGGADFSQRDADLARVVPAIRKLMPDTVIRTVALAVELNALSQELDRAVAVELERAPPVFSVSDYCAAYRRAGRDELRRTQIGLIGDVGAALDHFVHKRVLRTALSMMRKPARMAGLSALQDFLERGFDAFATMRGAAEFLSTIQSRETAIHEAIAGGSNSPFPDPMPPEDR
ncbi:MAG: hypothetical protein ABI533_01780 [Betaproteobacteria bacterium]